MCFAIPGEIIKIEGRKVTVKYPEETRQVLLGGDTVKLGDIVLVQMGIIIKVLSEDEIKEVKKFWIKN